MTTSGHSRTPQCLDAEALSAFIDGALPPDRRAAAIAHLSSCEVCCEALALATATLGDVEWEAGAVPGPHHRTFRSFVPWVAAAAVFLTVGAGWWALRNDGLDEAVAMLADARREQRFSDGRLSIDRTWKPAAPLLRSDTAPATRTFEVRSAAQALESLTESDSSARALHARGLAKLAAGDVDGSVIALEQAAAAAIEDSAVIRADLSAARLARFRRSGDRQDAARALEDAEAALGADPASLAASFNHAAALDALGEREKAAQAWNQYLAADPSSEWSIEVRRRLLR